jgi:hypothetical protein
MDAELYSGLVGALLGAVVGGFVTFLVQQSQTSRIIAAGTEQYARAAEAERQTSRRHFARDAAVDALECLAQLDQAVPHLRLLCDAGHVEMVGVWRDRVNMAQAALLAVRRAELVSMPIVGDDQLLVRWRRLHWLARGYVTLPDRRPPSAYGDPHPEGADPRLGRAQQDLDAYVQYMHATLQGWLDEEPLPPDLPPPDLHRTDVSVWDWRPDPGPAARAREAGRIPPDRGARRPRQQFEVGTAPRAGMVRRAAQRITRLRSRR